MENYISLKKEEQEIFVKFIDSISCDEKRSIDLLKNHKNFICSWLSNITPLHLSCAFNKIELTKFLIENGHPVNCKNIVGQTPILDWIRFCGEEFHIKNSTTENNIMLYLIKHGLEINAIDFNKQNILHYAIYFGHFDIVEKLIEIGVNSSQIDVFEKTPLDYMSNEEKDVWEKKIEQIKINKVFNKN